MPYKFNPFTNNLDFVNKSNEEVISFSSFSSFPSIGETGKLYIDESTGLSYYWKDTSYVPINTDEIEFYEDITQLPSTGIEKKLYVTKSPFSFFIWNGSSYEELSGSNEQWNTINTGIADLNPGNYIIEESYLTITLNESSPIGSCWRFRAKEKHVQIGSDNMKFIETFTDYNTPGVSTINFLTAYSGVDIIKISDEKYYTTIYGKYFDGLGMAHSYNKTITQNNVEFNLNKVSIKTNFSKTTSMTKLLGYKIHLVILYSFTQNVSEEEIVVSVTSNPFFSSKSFAIRQPVYTTEVGSITVIITSKNFGMFSNDIIQINHAFSTPRGFCYSSRIDENNGSFDWLVDTYNSRFISDIFDYLGSIHVEIMPNMYLAPNQVNIIHSYGNLQLMYY